VLLKKGDLIQFNTFHYTRDPAEWVIGCVLGRDRERDHLVRVFWFDDWQETFEPVVQTGKEYRMFSPGSSVG
jgi:hypothetical protein